MSHHREKIRLAMQCWRSLAAAAGATTMAITTAARADGVCQYTAQIMRPTDCGFSDPPVKANGVNRFGGWTGATGICSDWHDHAVRGTPTGQFQLLTSPPGTTASVGIAINDLGNMAGSRASTAHVQWACAWINGQFIELPGDDGWAQGEALAINNSNWVVGYRVLMHGPVDQMGFIWHDGQTIDIDPRPYGRVTSWCRDINDNGWVAGNLGYTSQSNSLPFLWHDGQLQLLALPAGAQIGSALGVSSSGVAVGESGMASTTGYPIVLPTVWRLDGTPVVLPLHAGCTRGYCSKISDDGVIYGWCGFTSGQQTYMHGAVWFGGRAYHQSECVPTVTGWSYGVAEGMSRNGILAGGGSDGTAFLLRPNVTPSDLTGDCRVDGRDLGSLLGQWGAAIPTTTADFDWDGVVGPLDLAILLGEWSVP